MYIDTKQAAEYLNLHPVYLASLRAKRMGPPHHKFGRVVRYLLVDLDAWAAQRRHA